MNDKVRLSRRQLLILASSSIVAAPLAALADGTSPHLHQPPSQYQPAAAVRS